MTHVNVSKHTNVAYSHLDSDHGLTTQGASMPLLWNQEIYAENKRTECTSTSKDTPAWCPYNCLALGGSIYPTFTTGSECAAGDEGQLGELLKLVQRMSSSHEEKKLCVAGQQMPSASSIPFHETESSWSPSLRVSHRSMVWLVLLLSCTYSLGPHMSAPGH